MSTFGIIIENLQDIGALKFKKVGDDKVKKSVDWSQAVQKGLQNTDTHQYPKKHKSIKLLFHTWSWWDDPAIHQFMLE